MGGLVLGEAVDTLSRSGQCLKIEEDQRNTVAFEARYDQLLHRFWALFTGRHDSGYTVELDPNVTREEFAREFSAGILDRLNLATKLPARVCVRHPKTCAANSARRGRQ